MAVTFNSPFRSAPRISKAKWMAVLDAYGSLDSPLFAGIPVDDRPSVAGAMYDLIVRSGHDPAIWLAIGQCEHSLGSNPDSVLWRNDTRSLTNARTVRDPSLTGWEIVTDAKRGSKYVRYQTVVDSLVDGMYRVDEPGYAYRKAGAVSIVEHTLIWTEGDGEPYAAKMVALINGWIARDTEEPPVAQAQIPGFAWFPADDDHYQRGRTEKIRGGAQHYTAGTNSLNWLAKTSMPPVSVHFLVKHDPTLEDRGWQLVRIEDTAWTTAFANAYTVAIEYEHDGKQPIPDEAYEVLAVTWADITRYVSDRGIGAITTIAGHKTWVNNPSLICPDGIDVGRIVTRWKALLTPGSPPVDAGDVLRFPETGFQIGGGFKQFWLAKGGVPVFGYPLTNERVEDGITVQWFERARFEHRLDIGRAEDWNVVLSRLGAEALANREAA